MSTQWWIVTPSVKRAYYFGKGLDFRGRSSRDDVLATLEAGAKSVPDPYEADPARYAHALLWLGPWEQSDTRFVNESDDSHQIIFGDPRCETWPGPLPGWAVDNATELSRSKEPKMATEIDTTRIVVGAIQSVTAHMDAMAGEGKWAPLATTSEALAGLVDSLVRLEETRSVAAMNAVQMSHKWAQMSVGEASLYPNTVRVRDFKTEHVWEWNGEQWTDLGKQDVL